MVLSNIQSFCKRKLKASEGFCYLQSGDIIRLVGGIRTPNSNQNCWELKGRVLEEGEKNALYRLSPDSDMTPLNDTIEKNITDYICVFYLPDSEIKYIIVGGKLER